MSIRSWDQREILDFIPTFKLFYITTCSFLYYKVKILLAKVKCRLATDQKNSHKIIAKNTPDLMTDILTQT